MKLKEGKDLVKTNFTKNDLTIDELLRAYKYAGQLLMQECKRNKKILGDNVLFEKRKKYLFGKVVEKLVITLILRGN